jgi:hypothetical protein
MRHMIVVPVLTGYACGLTRILNNIFKRKALFTQWMEEVVHAARMRLATCQDETKAPPFGPA